MNGSYVFAIGAFILAHAAYLKSHWVAYISLIVLATLEIIVGSHPSGIIK